MSFFVDLTPPKSTADRLLDYLGWSWQGVVVGTFLAAVFAGIVYWRWRAPPPSPERQRIARILLTISVALMLLSHIGHLGSLFTWPTVFMWVLVFVVARDWWRVWHS